MYRVVAICPEHRPYLQFRKEADFTPRVSSFFTHSAGLLEILPPARPPSGLFPEHSRTLTETYQIRVLRAKPCLDICNAPLSLKCTLICRHFDLRRKAVYCNRKPMQIFNRKPMYIIL